MHARVSERHQTDCFLPCCWWMTCWWQELIIRKCSFTTIRSSPNTFTSGFIFRYTLRAKTSEGLSESQASFTHFVITSETSEIASILASSFYGNKGSNRLKIDSFVTCWGLHRPLEHSCPVHSRPRFLSVLGTTLSRKWDDALYIETKQKCKVAGSMAIRIWIPYLF